ncbi:MAG: chromate transporter [Tissierellia bacterium]|nr:chromate transporter [Tissierellia bacterium]
MSEHKEEKKIPKKISYFQLFLIFFKINAVTFGGGYTIVPIIKSEFSDKRGLILEDEMLDLVALAQSGPGAMAISTSLLTGYKLKGPLGAIISTTASVLPCLILITIISYFYQQFRSNFWINAMLTGIGGVIGAILLVTTFNMGKSALKTYPVMSGILMVVAFIAAFFFHINSGLIILLSGFFGIFLFSKVPR